MLRGNMSYKFIGDVAYADEAFEADGTTLEKLFESCAQAVTKTMVNNPEAIKEKEERHIELEADELENLLYKFLDEVIFYKDADMLIFHSFDIKIDETKSRLTAVFKGEEIDTNKHNMVVDVKAVSYHKFKLEKVKNMWKAFVVLDV